MTTPYEIIECDDRADWLAKRATGIGASDMPAVLGVSNWRSAYELHQEKTGEIEPVDLDGVEAVEWGNILEPIIIEQFAARSDRLTRPSGQLLRSREHPWAMCTLDGEQSESGHIWLPLEAKTGSAFRAEDWADGAPEQYRVQCHQQMLVTDTESAAIACLIGGQRLVWEDVPRDEQLIRRIIHVGERFWQGVLDNDPPHPDGSESSKRALARSFPEDDGLSILLPDGLVSVAEELVELKAAKSRLKKRITWAENELKLALGTAEGGVFEDGGITVTWKQVERSGYTVKPTSYRQLRVKPAKE